MHLEHEIMIDAPVSTVWKLTEDVESWPASTPTMTSIKRLETGPLHVGSQALVKQPGQRATVWTVGAIDPPNTFSWSAKVFGMTMTGSHHLAAVGDRCRNTLSIDIAGRGSGLFGRVIGKKILASITTENEGFKRAAEAVDAV